MAAPRTQAAPTRRTAAKPPPVDVSAALIDCRKTLRALATLHEQPLSTAAQEDVEWTIRRVLCVMRHLLGANG